jgi:SAM-dependent methyltransferase
VQSPYYDLTRRVPIASRLSLRVRRAMFDRFMDIMKPAPDSTILDLGVTSDITHAESNYLEQWYPHRDRIVCAGVEDVSHLAERYPGVVCRRILPHQPLPFVDGQFDIVFSNAVVEHAGSRRQQRFFVEEALRVGRRFFITTPNRWFPIEMHTALPLLHYLPATMHRCVLSVMGLDYWASENQLNLLDARSLQSLFAAGHDVTVTTIRVGGFVSNLVAHGRARAAS